MKDRLRSICVKLNYFNICDEFDKRVDSFGNKKGWTKKKISVIQRFALMSAFASLLYPTVIIASFLLSELYFIPFVIAWLFFWLGYVVISMDHCKKENDSP